MRVREEGPGWMVSKAQVCVGAARQAAARAPVRGTAYWAMPGPWSLVPLGDSVSFKGWL